MSNRIITRHGTRTPLETDLEPYELGILKNGEIYSLYTGAPSGAPVLLTSTGDNNYNILTNKPTINGVTLISGLNMSDFGAVTLSSTLAVMGDATFNSAFAANGKVTFNDVTILNNDIQCNGMLYIQNVSGKNVQLPFMRSFNESSYTLGGLITTTSSTTNYMRLMSRSLTSGGMPTNPAYYEYYRLPSAATDMTASKTYNILTSKSAITVAQGGTGATTVSAARASLGLTGPSVVWTNDTTTTAFPSRDLPLQLSNYSWIGVSIICAYNAQYESPVQWFPRDGSNHHIMAMHPTGAYYFSREFAATSDNIAIGTGHRNGSTSEAYAIPATIYGII